MGFSVGEGRGIGARVGAVGNGTVGIGFGAGVVGFGRVGIGTGAKVSGLEIGTGVG